VPDRLSTTLSQQPGTDGRAGSLPGPHLLIAVRTHSPSGRQPKIIT
jgi:hypothetical protein